MSYIVNDRVYTDNPLLDGIIYNTKKMIDGIILKDPDEANKYETLESITQSDIYVAIRRGTVNFSTFKYDIDIISQLDGLSSQEIEDYARDNSLIPTEYRDELLSLASERFLENYVELNNYYRKLNGLPDYGSEELYLDPEITTEKYRKYFDFSVPISQFSNYQIGLLERYNILERVQRDNPDLEYLNHLGGKKIDIFTARISSKFEAIYVPDAEDLVRNRFMEILEKNRIIYMKRHYSLAYKFNSDYYDKVMIYLIICQSFVDMIAETPEWYIRRDVFDLRTVEFVLSANGVRFFSQIPLKYQLSLVRILNKVVKYKSCNKNIDDLASIFDFDKVNVYKYYLFKSRNQDIEGNYIYATKEITDEANPNISKVVEDVEKMYELSFVRTPYNDVYDNYIDKNINLADYDFITIDDPYWDGQDKHETVKENILRKDFTIQATKYMSFEAEFSLSEYEFQLQYFLNMILNIDIDTSNLMIKVNAINESASFDIRDLLILIYAISFNYYEPPTPDTIYNTNRNRLDGFLHYEGTDYDPDRLEDYNCDDTPEQDYECDGGSFRRNQSINCNGGYAWGDDTIYDPIHDKDTDGRFSADLDFCKECDGGKAYHHYPIFINANGSNALYTEEYEDSEEVLTGNEDIDFDGGISYGYDKSIDFDGSDLSSIRYERDYVLNGGKSHNSYINIKSGTGYYDRVSEYFEEADDKPILPEIDMGTRIYGFNLYADLDYLRKAISRNHSKFAYYRGFTLEDLGVEMYMVPETPGKFKDATEVMNIYKANKIAYDNLVDLMANAETRAEYEVYYFTYNYLFSVEMKQSYFMNVNGVDCETYSDYILNKDPILYNFYEQMMSEKDLRTRQYYISEYVDSVISAIGLYFNEQNLLKHIFYFVPTVSWSTTLEYLSLLLNFFKSYKTQFFDINAALNYDHKYDNKVYIIDQIKYIDNQFDKTDKIPVFDRLSEIDSNYDIEDYMYIRDNILTYVDYTAKYYIMNGGKAKPRIFYISANGATIEMLDGWDRRNRSYISREEFDGGISDTEDSEDSYETGDSEYYQEVSYFDLDGGDRRTIASSPIEEIEEYDEWEGHRAGYIETECSIDGGPSKNQLSYATYCTNEYEGDYVSNQAIIWRMIRNAQR